MDLYTTEDQIHLLQKWFARCYHLINLKIDIHKQIESQTIDTKKSITGIEKTIDNLKNENETKIFIINTYTKDGTQIRWTVKGDDNGNLCISDTKNMACIDQETGFLFNGKDKSWNCFWNWLNGD